MPDRFFSSQPDKDKAEELSRRQAELDRINAEIAAHQLGLQRKGGDPKIRNKIEAAIGNLKAKRDRFLFIK